MSSSQKRVSFIFRRFQKELNRRNLNWFWHLSEHRIMLRYQICRCVFFSYSVMSVSWSTFLFSALFTFRNIWLYIVCIWKPFPKHEGNRSNSYLSSVIQHSYQLWFLSVILNYLVCTSMCWNILIKRSFTNLQSLSKPFNYSKIKCIYIHIMTFFSQNRLQRNLHPPWVKEHLHLFIQSACAK